MPGDSGSSPNAGSIFKLLLDPGDFSLQPQRNPTSSLTPPSGWARHVRSIGDPQFGLAACCVVSACDSTDTRELPTMVIHHTHLFTSYQHSSLDGAQAGPISCLERHLTTSTPNIAAFDHLAHYRPSNQRGSMKGPTKKHHPMPSNELQRNSAGEHWINRSPHKWQPATTIITAGINTYSAIWHGTTTKTSHRSIHITDHWCWDSDMQKLQAHFTSTPNQW